MTSLALSTPVPSRAANLLARMQFVSQIELATPLPSVMKVEDVKIQNILRISFICVNVEDSPAPLNITQGTINWHSGNFTVQFATIVDNLGHQYAPSIYNESVATPSYNVTIEPHSMYNVSLFMVLMPGAFYSSSYQAWFFGTRFGSILPIEASITFPSNFSIPFYTIGANYSIEQNYKVLTWQKPPQQTLNVTAVFLPFPYNPQTISFKYLTDISSIFPVPANSKTTVTQGSESLSEYNGLKSRRYLNSQFYFLLVVRASKLYLFMILRVSATLLQNASRNLMI
ncbi:MAG TPA: hypothetical protein VMS95_05970 [Candidatus Krumholzibacteriaceae bacterium]|nr:hypothetical protein [Candidatus Krumholzibacteriaceae bacterium]